MWHWEICTRNPHKVGIFDLHKVTFADEVRPEEKHVGTNGIAAFIGKWYMFMYYPATLDFELIFAFHSTDEDYKGAGFVLEHLVDPLSAFEDGPDYSPMMRAFGYDKGMWEWLEQPSNKMRLQRFGIAMHGVNNMQPPDAILRGIEIFILILIPERLLTKVCVDQGLTGNRYPTMLLLSMWEGGLAFRPCHLPKHTHDCSWSSRTVRRSLNKAKWYAYLVISPSALTQGVLHSIAKRFYLGPLILDVSNMKVCHWYTTILRFTLIINSKHTIFSNLNPTKKQAYSFSNKSSMIGPTDMPAKSSNDFAMQLPQTRSWSSLTASFRTHAQSTIPLYQDLNTHEPLHRFSRIWAQQIYCRTLSTCRWTCNSMRWRGLSIIWRSCWWGRVGVYRGFTLLIS